MKTRVISAIVALIIVIPIIIVGGKLYCFAVATIGLLGFWEFISVKEKEKKLPILMKMIGVIAFIFLVLSNMNEIGLDFYTDYKILTSIIFLVMIPIVFYNRNKYNIEDALFLFGVIFFLGLGFKYLINVRIYNLNYMIFLCLLTIFTDTFAYITGNLIGKHKLAPTVSPKKTWEGFIGGLVFGTFISTMFYYTAFEYTGNIFILILVVALLSTIGQLGDLVFSSTKRYYKIKDFGNIMPGHGGVLDRLDSIIFVVLAFSFIVRLI